MGEDSQHCRVIAFLERNVLRHIALLKMLALYGAQLRSEYLCNERGEGALLILPITASPFDQKFYPGYAYTVMLSASSQAATADLLGRVPRGMPLVFKLLADADRQAVQERFPIRRAVRIISFTTPPDARYVPAVDVCVTSHVDPLCYELFAAQGHSRQEVGERFASSDARCVAVYEGEVAAGACFTYQNYAKVYEVSSVYTREQFRRRGLGQRVVQAALHDLLDRGCIPRYQVHEQNTASIALAERVGLQPFSTLTHWVTL